MSVMITTLIGLEVCLIPLLGVVLLVTGKVAAGRIAVAAERMFFVTLLLATIATFRALLAGETEWLMHAVTMAVLIVGSVSIPDGARGSNREPVESVVSHF